MITRKKNKKLYKILYKEPTPDGWTDEYKVTRDYYDSVESFEKLYDMKLSFGELIKDSMIKVAA